MSSGTIEWIHLVDEEGGEPRAVPTARALAGLGLEGDRLVRAALAGGGATGESATADAAPGESATGGATIEAGRQLTLIEAEAIEAAAREHGVEIPPGISRRNITVRGLDLNAAVGRTLRVGEARVAGIEPCHPCGYLERTSGIAGITRALVDRGGLRCQAIEGGTLSVGDQVTVEPAARAMAESDAAAE